jgi:hypothetical protein
MRTDLDHALREAMAQIAEAPLPPGMAQAAIRKAGRRRTARLVVAGVTAAAVALVAVPVAVVTLDGRDRNDRGVIAGEGTDRTHGTGQLVVMAYSGIANPADPGPADDTSLLLNPKTGSYDQLPYHSALPSPDGNRVLVHDGDNSVRHPSRAGILDRATGNVRWIGSYRPNDRSPAWSPDSRRVMFTRRPASGTAGFVLVDVETLQTAFTAVPDVGNNNSLGLGLVWTPDGKAVALTLSHGADSEAQPDTVTGIRFYGPDGRPTRTVNVADGALSDGAGFSPDGSRIALSRAGSGQLHIIDTITGATRQRLGLPGEFLCWYDADHVVASSLGDSGRPELKVVDLGGRTTRSVPLADQAKTAQRVHIGRSAGLTSQAARLAF